MKLFSFRPNYDEKFPHLDKAPITEAIIDFQVTSTATWNGPLLKSQIQSRLSNYPKLEENHEIRYELRPQATPQDLGCIGIRATSIDGCYVAQFNRRGFTLSRIKKYNNWLSFSNEASHLWSLYRELLSPYKINRIGIRFINRMIADYDSKEFITFFKDPPKRKQITGWDLENFMHRDVLRIPNTEYRLNLIKTIVSSPTKKNEVATILDCDVFYNQEMSCEWSDIENHLRVMHWIKNKVFFESIIKEKIKEFR